MKKSNYIILLFFIGVICFLVGRSTITNEIQYIKGDTVYDSIEVEILVPYKVEIPIDPILPIAENNLVDTVAIIRDYISKKSYDIIAFDNKEIGKLELFPVLQYNDLVKFDYSFTPIQHKITVKPKFAPFVSASFSTLDYIGFGGGFFYHNIGIEYQYNFVSRKNAQILSQKDSYYQRGNYHWFSGKYKF